MPSSAHKAAIAAMVSAAEAFEDEDGDIVSADPGMVLDAIPPGVLAQLAIERGGLEQVAWGRPNRWKPRLGGPHWRMRGLYDGEDNPGDEWKPVYRLTEEEAPDAE